MARMIPGIGYPPSDARRTIKAFPNPDIEQAAREPPRSVRSVQTFHPTAINNHRFTWGDYLTSEMLNALSPEQREVLWLDREPVSCLAPRMRSASA